MVGLDSHVGFIYKRQNTLQFLHSSYYKSQLQVLSEPLKGRNPLNDSKYRVVGKLLGEDMMEHWISGTKYE